MTIVPTNVESKHEAKNMLQCSQLRPQDKRQCTTVTTLVWPESFHKKRAKVPTTATASDHLSNHGRQEDISTRNYITKITGLDKYTTAVQSESL